MNDYSIAFVICVNDDELYEECVRYIDILNVPSGYEIEKIIIREAKSMTSAYNEAIAKSNSKYKVYLHQDTFIVNKDFILDCLKVFIKNEEVGMLGVVGAEVIPTNAIWWNSKHRIGKTYESSSGKIELLDFTNSPKEEYTEVQAIDGFIMITQYDVNWRNDIFDGWHFYDISQCMEFKDAGYKVVIPNQENPWCVHDCGLVNVENGYEQYRNKFLDIYTKNIFPMVSILITSCDSKMKLYNSLDRILNQTYRNIEIIVMCEESDKEELKEILNNNNNNITFYLNKEELTVNENIDRSLFDAKGEYFYIVNTNKLMKKNKIEKMMSNMIGSEFAVALNGCDFEDNMGLNNSNIAINGKEACNNIINNFDKLLENNVSAIINRKFYINQYGCFKKEKFIYIPNIATLTNCLMYGDLFYIKEKLDEDYSNSDLDWKNNLLRIQEMFLLAKYLKNEMIYKDTNEFDKLISNMIEYSNRSIENINSLNFNEKEVLIASINDLKKEFVNKYDLNFKYIGENVNILEGCKFIVPEGMIIEDNVSILESATFMLPYGNLKNEARIIVKEGCDIGKRIFVSATNKITIENDVIIASNCHITDHNHEYKKIGIPIRKQGVTSFTNEVVIGAGSWVANNCVIVGNIKIGRGCVIGANSVVLSDIPDYCVAVGNPATVKKCFDKELCKWIEVDNNWNVEEYNKKINNMKPLLTIGIPTYNRSYFLERCLDNIYKQVGNDNMVEVLVSDNASEDATKKVVEKYKQKYKNLRYNRNSENLGLMGNTRKVYELAEGKFINAHGDDDYYSEDIIYEIIDTIFKNNDSSVIYTLPKSCEYSVQKGYGIDEYVGIMSFMTTFVTGLIIRNDKYKKVKNKTKYDGTELDLVYFQMELLKNKDKFTIIQGNFFNNQSGQHRQTGNPYNFGKVFIEYYLDILMGYLNNGLKAETLKEEKIKLINNMIIPWVNIISNNQAELAINNLEEIYIRYFKDESYFEEKLDIIRQILKDKDI